MERLGRAESKVESKCSWNAMGDFDLQESPLTLRVLTQDKTKILVTLRQLDERTASDEMLNK